MEIFFLDWDAKPAIQYSVILLDCLTLLVSNAMLVGVTDFDHPDEAAVTAQANAEISSLIQTIESSRADWIIVSNEIGLGGCRPIRWTHLPQRAWARQSTFCRPRR